MNLTEEKDHNFHNLMKIRLIDFHAFDTSDGDESTTYNHVVQMFGIDQTGNTVTIFVHDYKPHFFIQVPDKWTPTNMRHFFGTDEKLKRFNEGIQLSFIKRKTLKGFDNKKLYNFIQCEFDSLKLFYCVKKIWYDENKKLMPHYKQTKLFESNIPPLLRFFHLGKISPSGWIQVDKYTTSKLKQSISKIELYVSQKDIHPLPECNDLAPFKICSFDIEASSSHGDFPVPVKTYKKLATNIVDCDGKTKDDVANIISHAFFGDKELSSKVDSIYPKTMPSPDELLVLTQALFSKKDITMANTSKNTIENYFIEEEGDDSDVDVVTKFKPAKSVNGQFMDVLLNQEISREKKISQLTCYMDNIFPPLEGDITTFIGSTFLKLGDREPYLNHCLVLGTCEDPILEKTQIQCCKTERELLLQWKNLIQDENPDIIIGYNIFGFDYMFLFYRASENDCLGEFLKMSRNVDDICCYDTYAKKFQLDEMQTKLASGSYDLKYIKMNGRVQIDLYNIYRREENLISYKLDYVAGYFIGDYITKIECGNMLYTKNFTGLIVDGYVKLNNLDKKLKVLQICAPDYFVVECSSSAIVWNKTLRWALAKDDVTPQDIFRMSKESDKSRYIIAKYCLQDCNLLHHLMQKTDILTGLSEMSTICSVPISFLVTRGQGIKLTSFVAKKCQELNTLMDLLPEAPSMDDGYEGATVLDPKCGLYLDVPVACVDYASLYPSSMISENISHDSKVWTKEYDLNGNLIPEKTTGNESYDNLPGFEYIDIKFDTYQKLKVSATSTREEKIKSGYKVCRFIQSPKGIMPHILEELLKARKATRALIKTEKDEFMKNVLDKRQLGYKMTANSLYGQCGAKTSTFYDKDIAASTTATGRNLLIYAKTFIETFYKKRVCTLANGVQVNTNAEYIYGDTDSIFFTFNLSNIETGQLIRGREALEITIELAQQAGNLASKFLKQPHDLEYEKTFMPFCLLSKKRYIGMLYEFNAEKCKRKEMGIVLKRRDNAHIVKDIYGGIIDILMQQKDIRAAVEFFKTSLRQVINKECCVSKLVISKSLRSDYKNPGQIAHKVLADRIALRDPGNKPNSGDRIAYVYIKTAKKTALQGDRIETPTFVQDNNLKIDYEFYITNQIMKPVQQLFALVLEDIWRMDNKTAKLKQFQLKVKKLTPDKQEKLRNDEIKAILFDPYLKEVAIKNECNQAISTFFKK